MRSRRLVPSLVASCLVLAACGSTVQLRGTAATATAAGDGLSPAAGSSLGPTVGAGTLPGDGLSTTGTRSSGSTGAGSGSANVAVPGSTGSTGAGGGSTARAAGPVEIGFFVVKDVGKQAAALGYSGLSTGDGATQAKAAATLINSHGGFGGHRVTPVIYALDSTGDYNSQYQAACSVFFDDHRAKAIVSMFLVDNLTQCAKKHGAPIVDASVNSTSRSLLTANPLLAISDMMPIEDAATNLTAGLIAQGWFKPLTATEQVKIGLITHDNPEYAGAQGSVAAELRRAGLQLTDTFLMPYPQDNSSIGSASSQGQAAALRFRSDGVNRVVAVDHNGFGLSWFAIGAASQGYYPKLGMSTLSEPSVEPAVLTPQQLAGSRGIGWAPFMDTDPARQPATSARTGLCLQAMRNAGQDTSTAASRLGALGICDGTWLLADTWHGGDLTGDAFLQGLAGLGTGYQSAVTFGTDFRRSHAGASTYRAIHYEAGCNCFLYTGAPTRLG